MNENIKNKWIEALRSGEYEQGTGQLKSLDNKYCCLGVLCEIYHKEVGGAWFEKEDLIYRNFQFIEKVKRWYFKGAEDVYGSYAILVRDVIKWAGLASSSGDLKREVIIAFYDKHKKFPSSLSQMNNAGLNFNQIADYIEENWKDL